MNYEQLIHETALADERLLVLTAENRALIRNLPGPLGPRFIDVGVAEQTMVGVAAGLALRGRVPVLHALAPFLMLRAYEFIRTDVGIPHLPVKLSAFIPGFLADGNGPTHQALEDIALMRGIPGMTVFAAADEQDMLAMLPAIWASPDPAYLRVNTRPATYQHAPFEIGKAEIVSEGTDITILTYGMLFEQALIAKDLLTQAGHSVGLVNLRSLKPIDEAAVLNVAKTGGLVVTLEDHFQTGGLYSIVAELLLENELTAKVLPLALKEKWYKPGRLSEVLEYEGFTGQHIARRIGEKLGDKASTFNEKTEVVENEFAE